MTPEEMLTEVRIRFIYIVYQNRFLCLWTGEYYSVTSIGRKYASICGTARDTIDFLLSAEGGLRVVDSVTFEPGEAEIVVSTEGATRFNLWVPTWIEPAAGDVTLFLNHLSYIFDGDAIAIKFFLQFTAHMLQKPQDKMAFAVLIIGGQGIGKSLLGEFLALLVGMENSAFIDMGMLTSQFNGFVLASHLIVVNEFTSSASKATRAVLKGLITSPVLYCNQKGIAAVQIQNRSNLIMFSNDVDVAKLDSDDRRHFVWNSAAVKREPAYYTELYTWFGNEGKHAVMEYLLNFDLSDFNPHAAPPKTASRAALIRESMSDQQQALHDMHESGEAPFDGELVVIGDVVEYLNARRGPRFTSRDIAAFLRSVGGYQLGQCRLPGVDGTDRKPRVWALHNADRWVSAAESDIAAAYVIPGGPRHVADTQPGTTSLGQPLRIVSALGRATRLATPSNRLAGL